MAEYNKLYKKIKDAEGKFWVRDMIQLECAAIKMLDYRQSDLNTWHCKITILYALLGRDYLRVHNGDVKYYRKKLGCFAAFQGVLPEEIHYQLQRFCKYLEGLFRCLPEGTDRTEEGLRGAVFQMFGEEPTHEETEKEFERLYNAAIFNKGDVDLMRARRRQTAQERNVSDRNSLPPTPPAIAAPLTPVHQVDMEDTPNVRKLWFILTAHNVQKMNTNLLNELTGTKVYQLLTEWCDTPRPEVHGFAYNDCVFVYDHDGNITFLSSRSADNNIYAGVDLPLMDTVMEENIAKTWDIYEKTFWANANGFQFCQACQELAKRGKNVEQLTLLHGSGGVGLSLMSAHLAAMYQDLHKYFDPNIFYTDDELRKVVDTLVTGRIFTGQERPEGNKQPFIRLDLLKKFLTGEGITSRMPYAVVTKLVSVTGWKRIEVNKMFEFTDITENDIESIIRRFSVIKIKAKFFEKAFIESTMRNPEEKGIFIRDPTAKEFLTCRHGIGAGHRIQQMFGEDNSNDSLIRTIQQYTRCGGDNGITEDYIRNACNLVKPSEKHYSCRKQITSDKTGKCNQKNIEKHICFSVAVGI